mgnify:CR=1 FL=1|jgi:ethanolamine utilization cobalamin adenosyltransferase
MENNNDNYSNQLNPGSKEFLDSRGCDLTAKDVSKIQSVESKSKGEQTTQGLGAEAQRRLNMIENGKCHLKS